MRGGNALSSVGAVVHHQQLEVLDVVDEEGLVARGHHVAGLLVGTVADAGHGLGTAETTTDAVVDTLGLSPAGAEALEAIGLVAGEARHAWRFMLVLAPVWQESSWREGEEEERFRRFAR